MLKKPPVIIGGIILVVVILVVSKKQSAATYSTPVGTGGGAGADATMLAQIEAQTEQSRIAAGVALAQAQLGSTVNLAGIEAQRIVALSKIQSDENVNLTTADLAHDVANRQLENNRILGLTQEDTQRLISTQDNQTKLTLGIHEIDATKFIAERALNSQEVIAAREFAFRQSELESNERINDVNGSRALTYAEITGRNQIGAIKAGKPGALSTFLGAFGGGLGRGLTALIP